MGILTRWLYLRLLGLTALVAIGSFWAQAGGLIGHDGIWPAAQTMEYLRQGHTPFLAAPTLLWISSSDTMLHALGALGVLMSVALAAGVAPRVMLLGLWLVWRSLVTVGGPFLSFQWDILLLETLLLSVPYAPAGLLPRLSAETEPPAWARYLLIWLCVKLTFESGLVKVLGHDPSWIPDLTALSYHWWTQPLPTWTSFVANAMPLWLDQALCFVTLVLELAVPLFAFGPRRARLIAGAGILLLQSGLALAGNYSYFNLLAAVLCIPLLDDAALETLKPRAWRFPQLSPKPAAMRPWRRRAGWALVGVVALLGTLVFSHRWMGVGVPAPAQWVLEQLDGLDVINGYGAFANMTKTRPEIIIEGSADGIEWKPYEFKWKPGRLDARPKWVAPWQPRLDWQMWFAALGECRASPWLLSTQRHLLLGTPRVLALFGDNPFEGAPPKQVRTLLYQYRFAPLGEKGVWWSRTFERPYCPALMLDAEGQLVAAEQP
jgi:hypothetical protein